MPDRFSNDEVLLGHPQVDAISITPNDTTTLANATRALYVGTGGNVAVQMLGWDSNTQITFVNVANGQVLPIRVDRVLATGTTGNDIIGLY